MEDRGLLLNVAYRLLGSVSEAEDAVQEGYARWYAMSEERREEVASQTAWLVTTVSRICLDVLGSARRRRTSYVGEWLPEPVAESAEWAGRTGGDPAELVALDETLGIALLVVLETMTPAERVAFVLHDVFGYRFKEVAAIVGRSPAACRQLASSARRRVREDRRREVEPERHEQVVSAFKTAWETGDLEALIALLDPGAAAVADGGGLVSAPIAPVDGAERIAAVFMGVHRKVEALAVDRVRVNGRPGLVARDGGEVVAVIALETDGALVTRVWVTRSPEKLTTWR